MVQTHHITKRKKIDECTSCMELVMFNSDSLFKIASYLPADGLLNLALTCRRFGIGGGDDSLSLIDETARKIVHDIATEEQKNAMPRYDGNNWLCKYNYLQSLRVPLTFDQLVGEVEYVEGNKSRVVQPRDTSFCTAFSDNIMMAGKHYVSFEVSHRTGTGFILGVMRPGEAMQGAHYTPVASSFYGHFNQRKESRQYNNRINCCMYFGRDGDCYSHYWREGNPVIEAWDGMEGCSGSCKIGMLLDLDEGTLTVYKNGTRLGVMKRGLAGHYCWVVSMSGDCQVTMKRGMVPES